MSTLIITEYIDRSTAGIIMSINNAIFPFSGILIALFFLYVNNWRLLFLISSVLCLLSVLISQKYFLESPRWLNSKNKFVETLAVFKEIAKINDSEENFNKFISVNKSKNNFLKFLKYEIK
jgi:MFS family permease